MSSDDPESESYDDLSPRSLANLLILQSAFRTWSQVNERKKRKKMSSKRERVALELLQTEREYVGNLNTLISSFLKPLLTNKSKHLDSSLINEFTMAVSGLEVIAKFHNSLQSDLESCLRDWNPASQLGKLFLQMAFYLKSYSQYVNHYQNVVQLLAKRKSDKQLQQLLESLKPVKTGKGIKDYMIMPIQRIPRYEMLLAELLRATWKSHVDYTHLASAHSKVQEVAVTLENQSADASSVARVMELSSVFSYSRGDTFKLVVPHRRYIAESECHILFAENSLFTTQTILRVYLFNDILLFAKPKKEKFSVKDIWFLRSITQVIYPKSEMPVDENNCYEFWGEDDKHINFTVEDTAKWNPWFQSAFRGGKAWLPHDADAEDDNRYKAIPPPPPLPSSKQAKKRLTKRSFFSTSKRESSFVRAFDILSEKIEQLSEVQNSPLREPKSPTSTPSESVSAPQLTHIPVTLTQSLEQFVIPIEFDENPLESPLSSRGNTPATSRVNSENAIPFSGEFSESDYLVDWSSSELSDVQISAPSTPERLRKLATRKQRDPSPTGSSSDVKVNVRLSFLEQIEKINVPSETEEDSESSQFNIDTTSSPLPSRVAKKQKLLTKAPKFYFSDDKLNNEAFPKKELSDLPLGGLVVTEPTESGEKSPGKSGKSWSTSFKKRSSLPDNSPKESIKSPGKEKRKQNSSESIVPPGVSSSDDRAGRSPAKPKGSKKLEKLSKKKRAEETGSRIGKKPKVSLPSLLYLDSDDKCSPLKSPSGGAPQTFILSPRNSASSYLLPADEKAGAARFQENSEISLGPAEKCLVELPVSPRVERKKSRSRRDREHSKVASSMGASLTPPSPTSEAAEAAKRAQPIILVAALSPRGLPPPVPPRRLVASRSLPQMEVDCTEGILEVVTRVPSGKKEVVQVSFSESELLVPQSNSENSPCTSIEFQVPSKQPSLDGLRTVSSVLHKFKELEHTPSSPSGGSYAQLRNSNSTSAVAVSQIIKKFSGEFRVEDCVIQPDLASGDQTGSFVELDAVKVKSIAAKFTPGAEA